MGVDGRNINPESYLSQRGRCLPPSQATRTDPPQLRERNVHRMQGDDESLRAPCIAYGIGRNWTGQYGTWPLSFRNGPFGTHYPPSFDSDGSSTTTYQADRAHPDAPNDPPVLRGESTGLTEANLATHTDSAAKTDSIGNWVIAPRYMQDSVVNKMLTSTKGGNSRSISYATDAASAALATDLACVGDWATAATDAVEEWIVVEPHHYDDGVDYMDFDIAFELVWQ